LTEVKLLKKGGALMNECLTKALDLKSILPNGKFILKNYSYFYQYENGKKTDTILGIKYEVLECSALEQLFIKVKKTNPLLTLKEFKELKESHGRIYVDFINAKVTFYESNGRISASILADDIIKIIDDEEELTL
jgi:hypothetical protein